MAKCLFFGARPSTLTVGFLLAAIAVTSGVISGQQQRRTAQPRGLSPVEGLSTQDILEIQQLGARYAYGLDTGADNGNYYASVFTPDGSFGKTVGRENLAALAREGGGRLKLRGYQHIVTNVIVEPTAEGAVGSQYIQVLTVGGNGKAPMIDHGGRYEDVYVKTKEGWRIKRRTYVQTFPPS